jgi:hypothetical protein
MTVTPYNAAENWSFRDLDISEPVFIFQIAFVAACAFAIVVCALQFELSRPLASERHAENNPRGLQQEDEENNRQAPTVVRGSKWLKGIALVNFACKFATTFSVMVGRLVVLWQIAPEYVLKLNGETGQLVFMNIFTYLQDNPSNEELVAMGCGGLVIEDKRNFTDPGEDFSKLLWLSLDPTIFKSKVSVVSIIIGLVIYLFLQAFIGFMQFRLDLELERLRLDGQLPSNWFVRQIVLLLKNLFCGYVVFILLESQQSVVLTPLTYVTPTPYCLVIENPPGLAEEKLIEFFAWSVAGIPVGLPKIAVGGCLIYCGLDTDDFDLVRCVIFLLGCYIMIPGIALFGCWLVLGFVVGPWSFYYSKFVFFTQTTTLLVELFAPAMFLIKDILQGVCELIL